MGREIINKIENSSLKTIDLDLLISLNVVLDLIVSVTMKEFSSLLQDGSITILN